MSTARTLAFALLACALPLAPASRAAAPAVEQAQPTLAVGGKGLFYYLPLTVAERRGYVREAGLDLQVVDFAG